MSVENNQLRQKLLQKHDYYARYCNNIKTNLDLLLSKEDIKKGLHKDAKDLCKYEVEIIKNGIGEYKLYKSIEEERTQINYYYNLFVMAMTSIIDSVLFEESKFRGFRGKRLILENLSRLKDATIGGFYNDKHKIPNFYIASEWDSFTIFTLIEGEEREGTFGRKYREYHYVPKENPTIQEMLEWMDIAENTLFEKRKKLAIKEEIEQEERKKEKEKREREWKEGEPARKKKQDAAKKRQEEEQLKIENEKREKEFEYDRQLKLSNRIILLFFIVLTVFVSYLAVGEGSMSKDTFDTIRNIGVVLAIPLMIAVYYIYVDKYKPLEKKDESTQKEKFIYKYSKKEKLVIVGIGLVLFTAILLDYMAIFFALVALIFVYGIYQAKKTVKNIDAEEMLFKEDVGIKDRIEKAIGTHIDIPYYGFEKVSDKIIDEVYHFFKDKKTEVKVAVRKIKESEIPYDTMDTESLVIMTEKYNKYDKLEKEGFAELQKIKAYGTALEQVLKEG
ncbi:hypothetical protein [Sulfurimonas sp.]